MSKKILVVEDEKNIAELERDYLEANGYTVEIEFDGKNGLDKAIGSGYDLVILDVMLPGIDGFEVCRQIRKHKECPVLMVSAKKDEIDKIRGLGLGADDYITKPFSPSELVARVTAHIARYERLTSKGEEPVNYVINVGKLSIDTHARRVFVNEKEVTLTNKEFDLLAFLASNPNVVYSKDDIFDKIWGLDAIGETSTVTVHINRIRDKIEADSSNPQYIETVWGAGYRFKAKKRDCRRKRQSRILFAFQPSSSAVQSNEKVSPFSSLSMPRFSAIEPFFSWLSFMPYHGSMQT